MNKKLAGFSPGPVTPASPNSPYFSMHLRTSCVFLLLSAAAYAADPPVVPLWPKGAPGSEGNAGIPEKVESTGPTEQRVSSIHNPSLTVYLPPKEKATGAGVIVAPGGGHRFLSITHEGYQVGEWLASIGVAAFVLKHRLAREEGSTYQVDVHALADAQRAIRTVRARFVEWNVSPFKVGIMGFSAGGELAALAGVKFDMGAVDSADPVERMSSRPDFLVLIYPGVRAERLNITKDTPPAFLMAAFNDAGPVKNNLGIFEAFVKAGVPADLHIWSEGGHGFGIRQRPIPISGWPKLVQEWMNNRGFLLQSDRACPLCAR
jgi:acetyl esterase/lipase